MNQWTCPCCSTPNAESDEECRVCRGERTGRTLSRPTLDADPFSAVRSLPAPLMLGLLAVILWFWWEPITRPLAATNVHSGWGADTHRDRRDELRAAHLALKTLNAELRASVAGTAALPSNWNGRLSEARLKWELYGQQEWSPGLGDVEASLNEVVLSLASIRHQLASGQSEESVRDPLDVVQKMLEIAERRLSDAH